MDVPPDNDVEGYETFGVALDTPTGAQPRHAVPNATVTIVDSEPVVQFAAATYTVSEGVAKATVGLKRTGSLVGAITVSLATAGGTATYGSGDDYNNVPATVVMASGLATKTFTFDVLQDAIVEPTETAPSPDGLHARVHGRPAGRHRALDHRRRARGHLERRDLLGGRSHRQGHPHPEARPARSRRPST